MQYIPKKWYFFYNWVLVVVSGLFIIAYALSKTTGPFPKYGIDFSLTLNSSIFALLTIVIGTVGYKVIGDRFGKWLGAILTTMSFDLFVATQITNVSHSFIFLYIVIWWLLVAYSGAFGIIVVLTSNFLTFLIAILRSSPNLTSLPNSLKIFVIGSVIASLVSYFIFWHRIIAGGKTPSKVTAIEGMPTDAKKQNETIIESIGDGVLVTDKTGKISLINPAAAEMTEWPRIDALGVDVGLVLKLAHENGVEMKDEENPFKKVMASNKKVEVAGILMGQRGKKLEVSVVISPLINENSIIGLVGVVRDISVQRTAERQRADFISTASHEMRTPVAAIEGYISLAMNPNVANIDEKAREFLDKAHQSTQQLGKLFQDLLTSSRAEDGRLVSHPEVIEMSQFIQHLAETFQLAAAKKHLVVDFVYIGENGEIHSSQEKMVAPLYYIHVDKERISEVVTNLFDNALKYTQAGKITIGLGGDDKIVQIFVQDTGPGIPEEDIPHLFQKFYRVDNSSVRTIGGTGLGLFICKKIVELYGGQIWVESELGKGSTFRINVPRLSTQKAEAMSSRESSEKQIAMPVSNLSL